MRNGVVYIGQRRPTFVGGDVAQLGYGFNLGGILRAGAGIIGTGTRALLGLPSAPKTAVGPNALVPGLPSLPGLLPGGLLGPSAIPNPFAGLLPKGLFGGGASGARRRRMNPLNLRALTRADRRVTRFAEIARKYVSPTSAHRRVRAFKRRKR